MKISHSHLLELLEYNPLTGIFINKTNRGRMAKAGNVAGTTSGKYIQIMLCQQMYYAHRLAWFYTTGKWPAIEIDHINGVKTDNRICNLREATHSENQQNHTRTARNNTSGITGVSWHKPSKRWHAQITVKGKHVNLGAFKCIHEAKTARLAGKNLHHQNLTNLQTEPICATSAPD